VSLLCKTQPNPAIFHVNMDEVIIFQRLSQQERVILSAMDYLEGDKEEDTSTSDSDSCSDN
jgi:hypothetical protein